MIRKKVIAPLLAVLLLCGCGSARPAETVPETAEAVPETTEAPAETARPDTAGSAEEAVTVSADELLSRYSDAHFLTLESIESAEGWSCSATLDGEAVEEYDYVWHADPGEAHDEVKDCPAEYYTGSAPDTDAAASITHDIYYYPELDSGSFVRVNYDGDPEWAYYYTAEGYTDYIFATLPVSGNTVPAEMMHSEAEAYDNAVLNITEPGTYVLSGTWHGQVRIDLGDKDETFADSSAAVTLVLNGADVTCTVAPALLFYSAYECDNTWEERTEPLSEIDTSDAGANVIVADGTVNSFTGANVYRMLKAKYKNADDAGKTAVPVQKKARKTDAAVYSYVSMNIAGETAGDGVLNVTSTTFEGLDTELHLTVNGGRINVYSQDDGINVNEDGVSVLTVNGGDLHILAGLGREGDGIDSNGFVVVNGGTVISAASPVSDSGLDSDCGTYINGGTVLALGSTMDWAESDGSDAAGQAAMNLQFSQRQNADEAIIVTDTKGRVVFAYDPDKDEVAGRMARYYQGAILSAPGIVVGGEYNVYVGGDVTGEETAGVYDPESVSGFSEGARQQCYAGSGSLGGMRPGGERPDMQPPGGQEIDPPQMGSGQLAMTPPEDFDPETMTPPEGFDPETMTPPDGAGPGTGMPGGFPGSFGGPGGGTPPGNFDPGTMAPLEDFGIGDWIAGENMSTVFVMTGKVNGFRSVTDTENIQ